jgi:zeta-carotene desaturase
MKSIFSALLRRIRSPKTATGWPATMEGAVRSGYLAAEAVLRSAGSPQKFLLPDLPASGLSRLFR